MMADYIRKKMIDYKLSQKDVCMALDITPSNLSNKLKRDNFTERELSDIAEKVFDSELVIEFKPRS